VIIGFSRRPLFHGIGYDCSNFKQTSEIIWAGLQKYAVTLISSKYAPDSQFVENKQYPELRLD
jgi:hypothetical protein